MSYNAGKRGGTKLQRFKENDLDTYGVIYTTPHKWFHCWLFAFTGIYESKMGFG